MIKLCSSLFIALYLISSFACKTPVSVIETPTTETPTEVVVENTDSLPPDEAYEPAMLPGKEDGMIQAAKSQAEVDEALIQDYIETKGLSTFRTPSGIHYILSKPGNNEHPKLESMIKAHYKGTLLDGQVFDSSYERNEPIELKLTQVVVGWQEAIPILGKGGKGTFIIPSDLAYGNRKVGSIPENAILIFEIELLDFK